MGGGAGMRTAETASASEIAGRFFGMRESVCLNVPILREEVVEVLTCANTYFWLT